MAGFRISSILPGSRTAVQPISRIVPVRGAAVTSIRSWMNPQPVRPIRPIGPTLSSQHPILFYDAITVDSGGEQAFRSQNFTNNTGVPIEFHSMRVQIELGTGAVSNVMGNGLIALDISMGGVPVTRGPIPTWMLCRSDNRMSESLFQGAIPLTNMAWYFTHPVPLLPGKTITIQAKHLGVIPQNATVMVSFAGRTSPVPIPNRVPFAAAWTSRAFGYAEAADDVMPPAALLNDTGRELHVSRIIGRSIAYDDGSTVLPGYRDFSDVSYQGITSLSCRFGVSQNRPILKTFTPWRTVFGENAAIETDFILKPGDYLTGTVRHAAGPVLAVPFVYSQNFGSFSIVGWREV